MKSKKLAVLAVLALCVVLTVASAGCTGNNTTSITGNVTVLVADSLKDTMADIETAFDARYVNVQLTVEYGNSAELADGLVAGTKKANAFIADSSDDAQKVIDAQLAKEYYTIAIKDDDKSITEVTYTAMSAYADDLATNAFTTFIKGGDTKALFKYHGYITS